MHVRYVLGTSERRTHREIGVARATQQYETRSHNDDDLRVALIRLTIQRQGNLL